MKAKKTKNHKLRGRMWRTAGMSTIGLTSFGGFYAYQSITDFEGLQEEITNFVLVNQETVQLNFTFALPGLVGLIIYVWLMRKRNADFFKGKASFSMAILIAFLYLVYSIIEISLFSLIGAWVGVVIDEFGFSPLANKNYRLAQNDVDRKEEYEREKIRIEARRQANQDIRGV